MNAFDFLSFTTAYYPDERRDFYSSQTIAKREESVMIFKNKNSGNVESILLGVHIGEPWHSQLCTGELECKVVDKTELTYLGK